MGYNNIDEAVQLPQTNGIAEHFMQQAEHRRLRDEQLQKESLARQDALTKYVGSEFDDKDFLSGTSYDPLINSKLAAVKQKYADMIRKNPDISMADLSYQLQKDTGGIHAMASAIKNVRANIKEQTKTFDQTKGMDGNAIEKLAMDNFIYKTDEKGNKVLKDVSELDPTKDYVGEVIKKHPEMYLDEGKVFDNALKGYNPYGVGDFAGTEQAGVKGKVGYRGKLYPFQEVARDANGKELLNANGKPYYVTKGETAMLNGKPVTINGQELKVVDDEVYSHWDGGVATKAILIKDLNSFNAKNKTHIEDGTPEAEILKKHFLYERLKNTEAKDWDTKNDVSKANFLDKLEAGVTNAASAGAKALAKVLKENQKTEGTDPGILLRAATYDPSVLEGANPQTVKGKSMFDITGTVGGWKIGYDKDRQPIVAQGIYVDPTNPGALTITDAKGNPTTYKGKDLAKFLKNTAGYNGTTVDKVDKALGLHMDENRNPKIVHKDVQVDLESKARIQNTRHGNAVTAIKSGVENFSKPEGNANDLQPLIDKTATVNGQELTIKKIEHRRNGVFSADEVVVTVEKPDGTTEERPFTRPKSGTEFKKFIENFTK